MVMYVDCGLQVFNPQLYIVWILVLNHTVYNFYQRVLGAYVHGGASNPCSAHHPMSFQRPRTHPSWCDSLISWMQAELLQSLGGDRRRQIRESIFRCWNLGYEIGATLSWVAFEQWLARRVAYFSTYVSVCVSNNINADRPPARARARVVIYFWGPFRAHF